jgi:protein required for attachment to host cells
MAKEWVVIANRAEAKFFSRDEEDQSLKFISSYANELGHPKNRTFTTEDSGAEYAEEVFAHELSSVLKRAKEDKMFEHLLICAAPQLLGKLRADMQHWDRETSVSWYNRDLLHLSTQQLEKRIRLEELNETPTEATMNLVQNSL